MGSGRGAMADAVSRFDSRNFSRFVRRVVARCSREALMEALPDFGAHLGYDGKAIESHSTGRVNRATGAHLGPRDWGRHETHGVDAKSATPWTKVKRVRLRAAPHCRHPLRPVDYHAGLALGGQGT